MLRQQLSRRLKSINHLHVQIHRHQIRLKLIAPRQRFLPISAFDDLIREITNCLADQTSCLRVIIDNHQFHNLVPRRLKHVGENGTSLHFVNPGPHSIQARDDLDFSRWEYVGVSGAGCHVSGSETKFQFGERFKVVRLKGESIVAEGNALGDGANMELAL